MAINKVSFRMDLIGPFGFYNTQGKRIPVTSKKTIALLALLAASPNGVRTRNWLQMMLWGTRDIIQAQSSLRRELSTLVKLLEASGGEYLLLRESQRVQLCLNNIDVDCLTLAMAAKEEFTTEKGDFLEGIDLKDCEEFEEWLLVQRQRIKALQDVHISAPTKPLLSANEILGTSLPSSIELIQNSAPATPIKPSVAVMPFSESHSKTGYNAPWFGEAIAEEIGMTLAQFPQLFVVSSASAAVLIKRDLTTEEIAAQLGVRYLLSGSIQQGSHSIRITVHLFDGKSGQQVWGTAVKGDRGNLLALQEQVAILAAPQIWTHIDGAERHKVLSQPGLEAKNYELYWRANAMFRSWNRDDILEAIRLTDELVMLNPTCPLSSSLAAFCNGIAFASRWTMDPMVSRRTAMIHCQNAMRYGSNNVEALGYVAGTMVSIAGDMQLADQLISHGLSILPAYQPTLFWGGWVDIAMGNAERASERFKLALRINPASGVRNYGLTGIGIAHLMQGQPREAYPLLLHASIELSNYPITQAALAVAAKLVGEHKVARAAADALQVMGAEEQVLAILHNPQHRDMLQQGLRMAKFDNNYNLSETNAA
jgi:TolB-like protein